MQQQGKLCNGIFRASASDKMIVAIIEDDRDSISFDVQINWIPSLIQWIDHEKGVGNQSTIIYFSELRVPLNEEKSFKM